MVRITNAHEVVSGEVIYCDFCGKSTDQKPTALDGGKTICTGSTFIEVDTKKVYLFEEENHSWVLYS